MSFRFLDHTADAGIEVEAASLGELFVEALAGFTDTITESSAVGAEVERNVEVRAPSLPDLLLEWLGECLFLFETEGLLFSRAQVHITKGSSTEGSSTEGSSAQGEESEGWTLRGRCIGAVYDPDRHPLKVLIKGITYHLLAVEERPAGGFFARVIFDI